jgi:hypothetical protein
MKPRDLRPHRLQPALCHAESVAALPPEYRHEPELALASGSDGLDATRGILRRRPPPESRRPAGGGDRPQPTSGSRLPRVWICLAARSKAAKTRYLSSAGNNCRNPPKPILAFRKPEPWSPPWNKSTSSSPPSPPSGPQLASFIPQLLGAIIALVLGWMLAKVARSGVMRLLTLLKFDRATEKSGLEAFMKHAELEVSVASVLGNLVYWLIILVMIVTVANSLGLPWWRTCSTRCCSTSPTSSSPSWCWCSA